MTDGGVENERFFKRIMGVDGPFDDLEGDMPVDWRGGDKALVSDEQKEVKARLLDTFQYGLEEVDVMKMFEGMSGRDVSAFKRGMQVLQLSDFCRGGCRFCGLDAKPYGKNNRRVLGIDSLKTFLQEDAPFWGDLMLYDASDPLDYPAILELVAFLECHPDYREISLLTSCPRGSEEMFRELMSSRFKKLKMQLSLSDQNRGRLNENGILDFLQGLSMMRADGRCLIKPVNERAIGRAHIPGRINSGFGCGDMMVLTPNGPYASEYHVASDLYPTERDLRPMAEVRRVYMKDLLFNFKAGDGFFGHHSPRLYNPESNYEDLDHGHEFKTETGMRHVVAYMFSILENMYMGCYYNSMMEDNWNKVRKALDEKRLAPGKNDQEQAFYMAKIAEMMNQLKRFVVSEYKKLYPPGMISLDGSRFDIEPYRKLVFKMEWDVDRKILKTAV